MTKLTVLALVGIVALIGFTAGWQIAQVLPPTPVAWQEWPHPSASVTQIVGCLGDCQDVILKSRDGGYWACGIWAGCREADPSVVRRDLDRRQPSADNPQLPFTITDISEFVVQVPDGKLLYEFATTIDNRLYARTVAGTLWDEPGRQWSSGLTLALATAATAIIGLAGFRFMRRRRIESR